jgi:hypothetical protein
MIRRPPRSTLYMFRTVFSSIIRILRLYIQHQVYVIQVLWLLASGNATEPVWHIHDAVCTVLDSWWWTKRPSETCTVLFQNKINLRYCASCWFYYRTKLEDSAHSTVFKSNYTEITKHSRQILDIFLATNASSQFLSNSLYNITK